MVYSDGHCGDCGELMRYEGGFPVGQWMCSNPNCSLFNKQLFRPHNMMQIFYDLPSAEKAYEAIAIHQARLIQ
jgi:hypothetical protein